MNKVKLKIILPVAFLVIVSIYACKKSYLDKQPLGALNASVLANQTGVEGLLIGAYHMLSGEGGVAAGLSWGSAASNWSFGSVVAGDSYKGSIPSDQGDITPLATFSYNANNPYLNQKWQALYEGIQRANEVLRVMPLAKDISAADQKTIAGEVHFLRGHFHFDAKKMWNYVPYVDETITIGANNVNVPNIDASGNFVDIWPKIEADFKFAMDNLPETQPQVGRANKWAAASYLAKVYMFEHKYTEAKALFDQIIPNGKTAKGDNYALVNYESNFNAATDNSAESVFAVQNSVNDGSGTNGNYGDNLSFPNGSGPGGCCGFNNPSISLANSYKTDANGLPLLDESYNTGQNVGDPNGSFSGTLDPRVDWTMGRPNIPYFDWGIVPATLDWIRDPQNDGWNSPKKNVYAKSQAGSLSSTETSFWGPTQMDANNTNLIRFADVLLMAAEAEVEVGSTDKALIYVNMVRNRAADPKGWVYKGSAYSAATGTYALNATPADKYMIKPYPNGSFGDKNYARKAIMFERKLELAMEGHRFFDLQRWDNGTGTVMAPALNAYVAAEKSRPGFFNTNPSAQFTAKKNEYYPLPQNQLDIANSGGTVVLKQNPNY